jgi:hypothetical protein
MKNTFIGMLLLASLVTSCQKENDKTAPTKENIQGSYKMTAATLNGTDVFNNPDPSFNYFEPCTKDNIHQLNGDNTYHVIDAGEVCPDADDDSGSWRLASATSLEINGVPSTIKSFDGRTLVLANVSPVGTMEATFVKQ